MNLVTLRSIQHVYHNLFSDATFWAFLFQVDQDLANAFRKQKCASCGGKLHAAHYDRKPRGAAENLSQKFQRRFSFCCDRDGCRKRHTPPSVRFLGRKVYLAAIVVLVAAMRQGPSAKRMQELQGLFDIDRRTLSRWRVFWDELFPQTQFWKEARARIKEIVNFPLSILETFVKDGEDRDGWKKLLLFLSPISASKGVKLKVSEI